MLVAPDHVAKILFTSGSTGTPKGVINTHRMLCSNQQAILQTLPFLGDEPPVLVDWLPWHHTFGGNHNVGIVVYNGGSLYLDEGRPMPGAFDESVRNLHEVAPTFYLNVPKGYEELVRAFRADPPLASKFFNRVQVLFYAAAGLSQHVADELQEIAHATCGERLVLVTGLGATETAPMAICRPWASELSSAIGLPVPGVEAKLVPWGEKLEIRVRGPNVTPGYWRQDALTREAFDDEGFYCMGDAARPVDPRDLSKGLVFDGRIKEDFKLSTGTWVSVGPLRARILMHFAPYVRDAVIAGHDRDDVSMLVVPDLEACRALCPDLAASAPASAVIGHSGVRSCLRALLASFAAGGTGSATRLGRAIVLEEPPSLDAGEVTDKGSLNQRAILDRRRPLVDDLYADHPPPHVIRLDGPAHEC
jgi:feruloyl-CoA synthase